MAAAAFSLIVVLASVPTAEAAETAVSGNAAPPAVKAGDAVRSPADAKALTGAITYLLNAPDERKKYAQAGLHRVNSVFSWKKAAEEVVEVYREAINGYRRFS